MSAKAGVDDLLTALPERYAHLKKWPDPVIVDGVECISPDFLDEFCRAVIDADERGELASVSRHAINNFRAIYAELKAGGGVVIKHAHIPSN